MKLNKVDVTVSGSGEQASHVLVLAPGGTCQVRAVGGGVHIQCSQLLDSLMPACGDGIFLWET